MAQTQYQILYRYVNEATNTEITNVSKYNKTEEFYTKDHKLYVSFTYDTKNKVMVNGKQAAKESGIGGGISSFDHFFNGVVLNEGETEQQAWARETASYSDTLRKVAEEERTNIISNAMGDTAKANNLYIYDGTHKIFHKKYVPDIVGYKVANPSGLPQKDLPTTPDDYDKPFIMLGGYKPGVDDAYYVCKPEYIKNYKSSYDTGSATQQNKSQALTSAYLANLFPFDFYPPRSTSYVPEYGEQEPSYVQLNASSKLTLDGEDYIVFSSETYYPTFISTQMKTEYIPTGKFTGYYQAYHKYKYDGGCVLNRPFNNITPQPNDTNYKDAHIFSGFFLTVGNGKMPKEFKIATSDFSTIANTDTFLNSSGEGLTDGDKVLDAYEEYCSSLVAKPVGDWALPGEGPQNAEYPYLAVLTVRKVSEMEELGFDPEQMYDRLAFTTQNITRAIIPEHYETTTENPYMVKDQYIKIEGDPWMLHSVHNSLERGLEMAKKLVKMIGLDNVKLVKTVPTDQKIKIS